jgi:protocatechuate 3,4-dioxygenase beta subunit
MTRSRSLCLLLLSGLAVTRPASAGEIRGRVLVDGKPAAGVVVTVLPFEDGLAAARREARREQPAPLASAPTRPDGAFSIVVSAAPGTAVHLGFRGAPAASVRLDSLVEADGQDLADVRLPRAAPLAGRVVDDRGLPAVGASVTLWAGRGRGLVDLLPVAPLPQLATTKADGSFRFEAASDEGNQLRVEAPGFATAERRGVRSGALTLPIRLALGQVVRGTVTLPDRRTPAAGALVHFEGRTTTRAVEARADGAFVLDAVPREAGSLVAEAGERGRAVALVAPGASEPVALTLAPATVLSGRVVEADGGRPLAGVRLLARGRQGGSFVARSGADGRYAVRGLSPQPYTLTAEDARFVPWSRPLTLLAGQPESQDVALVRGATLSGRVVSEQGAPIEGARLRLTRSGENVFQAFVRSLQGEGVTRSGRDGSFKATRLPPGERQGLVVQHEDFEERTIGGVSLAAGGVRSGLTIVMRRGLSIRGTVKDEEGRALAGAEVTLSRARTLRAGRGGMQMSLVGPGSDVRRESGADGRFEFRGLSPGDYSVAARRSGFARASVDSVGVSEARPGEPLELVLRPGASITGYIRDRSGSGAAGWLVTARPAGGGTPAFGPGAIRTEEPTGPDGLFVLEGLTSGEAYDLQVMGSSGLGPRRAGVLAPADGIELTVAGTGQLRGRVVDAESGRPVPDFELRYEPDAQGGMRFVFRGGPGGGRGPYERQSFHAEDGSFVLDEVPAGKWTVQASARGYQPGSVSGLSVAEGDATEGVDVRLSRGAAVSGRVLEARSGRPIVDASVKAEPSGGGESRMPTMVVSGEKGPNEATTDADGRYEIAGLAPGPWLVTASHAEWSEASASVDVKDAPATLDLRLGKGGAVSGTVLAGGRPVAGAQVALSAAGDSGFRPGAGFLGGGEQAALSDDGGRFRFERLAPGRYTLTASLREQSSAPVESAVTGEAVQEVQLSLAEGALVRGTVRGLPDAQLAGVNVSARGRDYFASTRTGAGGAFELSGAPEGTLTLNANAGDFLTSTRNASASVTIAPGQTEAQAEIVFEQGFRLDGHVTRGGKPVAEAIVNAFSESGSRRGATSRTDESGAFALDGLEEGRYRITAMGSGTPISRTVEVSGDSSVELEAPPARLAGTVVEADSGRPLAEVGVRVEDTDAAARVVLAAATDSSGRFQIEDVEPKRYRASFQKQGYQVETRELSAGEDSDVRVELRRGEGLSLEARDGIFGTPLRGLFVRALDAGGQSVFAGDVPLDSDGRGEVPALRPGSYELRAQSSGYAVVSLPGVAVPSRTLSLVLTPGGALEIQAGPQTLALPEASALLLGAEGRPCLWNPFTSDGKIRLTGPSRSLENVPPGAYTLRVLGGASRELTITEGGRTAVSLP